MREWRNSCQFRPARSCGSCVKIDVTVPVPFRTRFAPAPTGFLHLGHVVNAIHVWDAARQAGGRVILRIEDHDRQRSRPDYEAAILEDLAWLGFVHDGPLVRQSERDAIYQRAIQQLIDKGLVYGCSCTRAQI